MADTDTVRVRWSQEPEKTAWMLEHCANRPIADVCRDFERKFGHPLKKTQVTVFRAKYGISRRRGNRKAHRKDWLPVGSEREQKGYVIVKVRDLPGTQQSRDNWRFKHIVEWERANGTSLPDGWTVLFADRDTRNFAPENLVAIPKTLMGILNTGPKWHDRATLDAAVALAKLKHGTADVLAAPRRCGVCGREFVPDRRFGMKQAQRQVTCRECLDKGLRAEKDYGTRVCPACGGAFKAHGSRATYCSKACREKAYSEKSKARTHGKR